ncbi:MAG: hypothetical protein IJV72_07890 [Clostridia bacterium]|nr:hypothetical protein [Clostridia bacterium]
MKTGALWTILIIAAVIVFIASLKATVVISYSDEVKLWVKVLFLKINILPSKEKKGAHSMSVKKAEKIKKKLRKKAEKKKLAAAEKEKEKAEKKATHKKKTIGETIANVKMLTSVAVIVIERFFKHLRIRLARIKIIVATGDAASTAMAYGAITQSINVLFPLLESVKNFEKLPQTDISVDLDYLEEEPTVDIKLMFSIRVWHVFDIGFSALKIFIKHKFKQMARNDESGSAPAPSKTSHAKNHKL